VCAAAEVFRAVSRDHAIGDHRAGELAPDSSPPDPAIITARPPDEIPGRPVRERETGEHRTFPQVRTAHCGVSNHRIALNDGYRRPIHAANRNRSVEGHPSHHLADSYSPRPIHTVGNHDFIPGISRINRPLNFPGSGGPVRKRRRGRGIARVDIPHLGGGHVGLKSQGADGGQPNDQQD